MEHAPQAGLTANHARAPIAPQARSAAPPGPARAPVVAALLIGPLVVLFLAGEHLNPLLQF